MITRICHGYLEPMLELVNPLDIEAIVWGVRWETIDCEGYSYDKVFPLSRYDCELINKTRDMDRFKQFKFANLKVKFKLQKLDIGYRAILFGNYPRHAKRY